MSGGYFLIIGLLVLVIGILCIYIFADLSKKPGWIGSGVILVLVSFGCLYVGFKNL